MVEEVPDHRRGPDLGGGRRPSGHTVRVEEGRQPAGRPTGQHHLGGLAQAVGDRKVENTVEILDAFEVDGLVGACSVGIALREEVERVS